MGESNWTGANKLVVELNLRIKYVLICIGFHFQPNFW